MQGIIILVKIIHDATKNHVQSLLLSGESCVLLEDVATSVCLLVTQENNGLNIYVKFVEWLSEVTEREKSTDVIHSMLDESGLIMLTHNFIVMRIQLTRYAGKLQ